MSQGELGLLADWGSSQICSQEENRKDFQYGYDEEVSCQKEARSVAVLWIPPLFRFTAPPNWNFSFEPTEKISSLFSCFCLCQIINYPGQVWSPIRGPDIMAQLAGKRFQHIFGVELDLCWAPTNQSSAHFEAAVGASSSSAAEANFWQSPTHKFWQSPNQPNLHLLSSHRGCVGGSDQC